MTVPYLEDVIKGKDTLGSLKEPNYEAVSTLKPEVIFTAGRQKNF